MADYEVDFSYFNSSGEKIYVTVEVEAHTAGEALDKAWEHPDSPEHGSQDTVREL